VSLEKPYNPSALARFVVIAPSGRESCETVTIEFVSRPLPCTGGNEARDVSPGSGPPLARGEGSWLFTELLDRGVSPSRELSFT
jgi:hypothetical protein